MLEIVLFCKFVMPLVDSEFLRQLENILKDQKSLEPFWPMQTQEWMAILNTGLDGCYRSLQAVLMSSSLSRKCHKVS